MYYVSAVDSWRERLSRILYADVIMDKVDVGIVPKDNDIAFENIEFFL